MFPSVALLALLGSAAAHMEVQFPPPLKSKFNPNTPSGAADYNMIAPLLASGADFPCKGYQSLLGSPAGAPTASFAVGAPANMTITGGANHGGGSCQISLSTDNAQTFTVIHSFIGGCPAAGTSNLDFTIPADAPTGDHVLAWTWHNQIGNREMYMNCAAVTLTGGGGAKRMEKVSRAAAYSSRPGIFIANVGSAGDGCTTAESFDVDYPEPGPDVTNDSAKVKAPGCGVTQKAGSGGGGAAAPPASGGSGSDSGAGAGSSSSASSAAPSPTYAPAPAPPAPATTLATSTRPTVTPVAGGGSGSGSGASPSPSKSSAAAPKPTDNGMGSSTNAGASPPSSSSGGSSGSAAAAAAAAAAANAPGSACADEGAWACLAGGASFQRCASGQWSVVQALAPGMECSGGVSETMNMVAVAQ